jgi:predicted ATPase
MHFERGQDLARAVRYHHLAAQQAMQRSGYQEAIGHLRRGLELLQRSPRSPDRVPQELAMQMALGAALRATKAYGAPEVEHAYLRARELCRQLDEPPEVFPVLYSLYELHEYVGAFERSGE